MIGNSRNDKYSIGLIYNVFCHAVCTIIADCSNVFNDQCLLMLE